MDQKSVAFPHLAVASNAKGAPQGTRPSGEANQQLPLQLQDRRVPKKGKSDDSWHPADCVNFRRCECQVDDNCFHIHDGTGGGKHSQKAFAIHCGEDGSGFRIYRQAPAHTCTAGYNSLRHSRCLQIQSILKGVEKKKPKKSRIDTRCEKQFENGEQAS